MRFTTLLSKFGAASVAGVLTIGGGMAFAEGEGDTGTEPAPTEEVVVVAPVEEGGEITPTETEQAPTETVETVVVIEEGTGEGDVPDEEALPEPHVRKENHGKHVSEAAKTAPKGKGGVHGKAVSEVARSDAGKKQAHAKADKAKADKPDTPAKGHGKK